MHLNDEISKLEEDFQQKLQEKGYDTIEELMDENKEFAQKLETETDPK